jgi:5-methylcytosine-specific restriction endonuclease McrA
VAAANSQQSQHLLEAFALLRAVFLCMQEQNKKNTHTKKKEERKERKRYVNSKPEQAAYTLLSL